MAVAIENDAGLDVFRQAVIEAETEAEALGIDTFVAQIEIWDAAVQYFEASVGLGVLGSIFTSVTNTEPPLTFAALDEVATNQDTRADRNATIERLKKLDRIEYDKERAAVASSMGCRVSTLDKLVNAARS